MTRFLAATVLQLLLAGVCALLEHTHRRTAGTPRLPFGADPAREADLWRVWHDLDVSARR